MSQNNPSCAHCGNARTRRNGFRDGRRYFYCNGCHRCFTPKEGKAEAIPAEENRYELPTKQRRSVTVTVALRPTTDDTLREMWSNAGAGPAFTYEEYLMQVLDNHSAAHRLAQIAVTVNTPASDERKPRWLNKDFHNIRTALGAMRK